MTAMWTAIGFAALIAWVVGLVLLVRRQNRGQPPHVDPYDWQ